MHSLDTVDKDIAVQIQAVNSSCLLAVPVLGLPEKNVVVGVEAVLETTLEQVGQVLNGQLQGYQSQAGQSTLAKSGTKISHDQLTFEVL